MIEFLQKNYEWVFSGIGSGVVFWILGYWQGSRKAIDQKQEIGSNSTAIQVGRDLKGNVKG